MQTLVILLRRLEGQLHLGELRLGGIERDLELCRIDAEELVAGRDLLALMDIDRSHHPGNFRRTIVLAPAHRIVGRLIAAAAQPEVAADGDDGQNAAQHQQGPQPASAFAAPRRIGAQLAGRWRLRTFEATRPPAFR